MTSANEAGYGRKTAAAIINTHTHTHRSLKPEIWVGVISFPLVIPLLLSPHDLAGLIPDFSCLEPFFRRNLLAGSGHPYR